PRAYYAMGMLRRQQNKVPEARIAFEKTVALDRNISRGHLQLGYTLLALGQPEAALPELEEGYRLNPEYQNIQFYYAGLGAAHLHLGHLDQAIDFLRKSRAATNVKLWYNAMWLAAALGLKGEKRRNLALRDASIDLPHLPLTGHSGNPCILRDGGAAVGGRPNDNPAVAEAFARAAHVTRLELRSNRIVVNPIEPRAALAEYDPARRHFALHVGCQGVF